MSLQNQIRTLSAIEVLIMTNSGTFSAEEACRKIGTGDPAFAEYRLYERVGGGQREVNPDAKDVGRLRHVGATELKERRAELAKLQGRS